MSVFFLVSPQSAGLNGHSTFRGCLSLSDGELNRAERLPTNEESVISVSTKYPS